jgi:hypothetical protein
MMSAGEAAGAIRRRLWFFGATTLAIERGLGGAAGIAMQWPADSSPPLSGERTSGSGCSEMHHTPT